MKIKIEKVKTLHITDIDRLDPIVVNLEDYGESSMSSGNRGIMTIRCHAQVWTHYWGGLGSRDLADFFCSCGNDYLAGKFASNVKQYVEDLSNFDEFIKRTIIEKRKTMDMDKDEARELFDDAWLVDSPHGHEDFMYRLLGDEWWYDLPTEENHEYKYMLRIFDAVKGGLKMMKAEEENNGSD